MPGTGGCSGGGSPASGLVSARPPPQRLPLRALALRSPCVRLALALRLPHARLGGGRCEWEGHVHVPVWTTPAALALTFVGCLFMCWRQKEALSAGGKKKRQMQALPRSDF